MLKSTHIVGIKGLSLAFQLSFLFSFWKVLEARTSWRYSGWRHVAQAPLLLLLRFLGSVARCCSVVVVGQAARAA